MNLKPYAITAIAGLVVTTAFAASPDYQFNYPAKLYQPVPETQSNPAKTNQAGQLSKNADKLQSNQQGMAQNKNNKNANQKKEDKIGEFITIVADIKPNPSNSDDKEIAQNTIPTVTSIPPNSTAIDARMGGQPHTAIIDTNGNLKMVVQPAPTVQRKAPARPVSAPLIPGADGVTPNQAQRILYPNVTTQPGSAPVMPTGENPQAGVLPAATSATPVTPNISPEQAAAANAQAAAQAADANLESPIAPVSPPSPVAPVSPDAAPAKPSPNAKNSPQTKPSPTAKLSPDAPEATAEPATIPAPPIKPGYLPPPGTPASTTTTTTTTDTTTDVSKINNGS